MPGDEPDGVDDRLRLLLLEAYAEGVDVAGEWYLLTADSMIPNFTVTVTPTGTASADQNENDGRSDSGRFMHRLQELLLEAFAAGTPMTGSRILRNAVPSIPDWYVVIERESDPYENEDASADPTFHRK